MEQADLSRRRPENVVIPKGKTLHVAQFAHRTVRDTPARLGRAQVPGRLRSEISPRADALCRHAAAPASTPTTTPVPAEHFTFSTMVLPAGCEGPLHLHTDAEEVFFVLRGNKLRLIIEKRASV